MLCGNQERHGESREHERRDILFAHHAGEEARRDGNDGMSPRAPDAGMLTVFGGAYNG